MGRLKKFQSEAPLILNFPSAIPPISDPVVDAILDFERFEELEDEAFSRIAVSVVFDAIPKSRWMRA